jgi:hypothetical protein
MATLVIASCCQKKEHSISVALNDKKLQVRKWHEAFNTKNPELLKSILHEQWQDLQVDPKNPIGKKEAGSLLAHLITVFPDFNCEIKDIPQDGNKVIVRSVLTGKQYADFRGLP